jgi:hypothetical protein
MTEELIERSRKYGEIADPTLLVTTVALAISLVIAATAVSIGIARAGTLIPIVDGNAGRFALAILLGLAIAGMGGVTAAVVSDGTHLPRRD